MWQISPGTLLFVGSKKYTIPFTTRASGDVMAVSEKDDSDEVGSKRTNVKYSICITNFNTASILEKSINSILNQIDDSFEVVVVDSCSTDGSAEILRSLQSAGQIRLMEQRCTRGRGRQISFLNSAGSYIIDQIDMDDVYKPVIKPLIEFYHKNFEGKLMATKGFLKLTSL
ncbi:MAG: glycosyltransferase, partial [Thaumarchaeota archaeon]|nr:glycosyltransferase [Nitrososphaerota archaeon]